MTNIELKRDHEGTLHLFVAGVPALNVTVANISNIDGKLVAVAYVPLDRVTIGEVDTVIPMSRKAA
jgi:hypothetical protein